MGGFQTCQRTNSFIEMILNKTFAQKLRAIFQFCVFSLSTPSKDFLDWNLFKYIYSIFFQQQENDECGLYSTREKKINELKRWTGKWVLFRKQMTEIKRWLYAPKLSNSHNLHWLAKFKQIFHHTFVPLENFRKQIQICSLTPNKNGFSQLKFAWIPSVHDSRSKKRAAGELFSCTFLL